MKKELLETGKIVSTHGLHGEVKILPWADSPEFLLEFDRVFLGKREYAVEDARVQKTCVLMKLEGIDTVEDAAKLRDQVVFISREDIELEEGAIFIQDLLHLPVLDESGAELGKLQEVISTGANDVFYVKGAHEYMIPAVPEFVLERNIDEGFIRVRLIEGCRPMRFDILTLFPDAVDAMMQSSILGRAQKKGFLKFTPTRSATTPQTARIRSTTTLTAAGGARFCSAIHYIGAGAQSATMLVRPSTIFLSACGKTFNQEKAKQLAGEFENIVLVCGHYEGIDQRFIDECVDEEISWATLF